MISKPEQITQTLISALQAIQKENGYKSDTGKTVYFAEAWFDVERNRFPCISVFLEEEEAMDYQNGVLKAKMSYQIEVHGKRNDSDFNLLDSFDDIKKCILLSETLANVGHGLDYQGFHIHPQEEGRSIISGKVGVVISYIDNLKEIA